MTTERTINADRLIARIMRLAQGDLHAVWTTAGIVKIIEEECRTIEDVSKMSVDITDSVC